VKNLESPLKGCQIFLRASSRSLVALRGRRIAKAAVGTLVVVVTEVARQPRVQVMSVVVVAQVEVFVFHCAPEPYDEHVVQGPASAIHADGDVCAQQNARKSFARELAALVGVEDSGPAAR